MRVLLVGDTHGNLSCLERGVFPAAERVGADVIFQVGDFGWWPRSATNDAFRIAARRSPVPLWWIDGNHEDHASLAREIDAAVSTADRGLVALGGNLCYVPRGTRLDLDGVTVLACGGAHSIDRCRRSVGIDWFEEEHISETDVERCTAGGAADVLLCHDAPAGWVVPNLPDQHSLPSVWRAELPACWDHRRRLGDIAHRVEPRLVVHGHYHSGYEWQLDTAWGPMQVVGLSEDGTAENLAVLDCHDGAWQLARIASDVAVG